MTTEQHPITPTPELVQQWRNAARPFGLTRETWIATQAARWGADQELEACCSWADATGWYGAGGNLRAARRPKPPSLAEQATAELDIAVIRGDCITTSDAIPSLRAALKRLQELEEGNE